jgi:hypothetical protein
MRDVVERREQAPDARETLEPMLDDLARGLGYDRALVLAHDDDQQSLRGLFGLNIRDDIVRAVSVPLSRTTRSSRRCAAASRSSSTTRPRMGA